MRIVLACVGNNDPINKEGQPGPILTFMDYARANPDAGYYPDRIYLLSTLDKEGADNPTQHAGEATVKILNENHTAKLVHLPLHINNPTDLDEVVEAMRNAVSDFLQDNNDSDNEYFVFVNPGTPQMQITWLSFINYGFLKATPLQSVKVKQPGSDEKRWVIEPVKMAPLFESDLLKLACSLTSQAVFITAKGALMDIANKTRNANRNRMACLFSRLLGAYDLWQRFYFDDAHKELKEFVRNLDEIRNSDLTGSDIAFDELSQATASQVKALQQIAAGDELWGAIDLYHRARMLFQLNNHRQAVVYCWDICESIIAAHALLTIHRHCKLADDFIIPPGRFDKFIKSGRPEAISIRKQFKGIDVEPSKYFDYRAARQILLHPDIKEPLSAFLKAGANDNAVDALRIRRNEIVHQRKLARQKDGEIALELAAKIIDMRFNKPPQTYEYPLSFEAIKEIAGKIQKLV